MQINWNWIPGSGFHSSKCARTSNNEPVLRSTVGTLANICLNALITSPPEYKLWVRKHFAGLVYNATLISSNTGQWQAPVLLEPCKMKDVSDLSRIFALIPTAGRNRCRHWRGENHPLAATEAKWDEKGLEQKRLSLYIRSFQSRNYMRIRENCRGTMVRMKFLYYFPLRPAYFDWCAAGVIYQTVKIIPMWCKWGEMIQVIVKS